MYTRSFGTPDEETLSIPEKYSGMAFDANKCEIHSEIEESHATADGSFEKKDKLFGTFSRFLPAGLFDKGFALFKKDGFKLGTEEILILIVAAFLLFSKEGDKECALMLIMLLFIS